MPKAINPDSSPGSKLIRLFIKLMLEGKKHYQSDLAMDIECSPQTIIRLIAEIEAVIGSSLEVGNVGKRKYYQLKSLSARRTLGLDFEELRYLSLCHDFAAQHLPQHISARVEKTIFSLSALMADPDFARREETQTQQVSFSPKGYIDYEKHFSSIEKLIDAAHNKLACLIEYKSSFRKDSKIYYYAPGKIVSMNSALYVQGYKLSKDFTEQLRATTFAIHRIQEVTKTDKHFKFDASIDDEGCFGMKWHEPRTFRIQFDEKAADYVRERIWCDNQKIEELEDGGIVLKVNTVSEPELMSWVRSFGDNAHIISFK
ncbi:YafY family protein [Maridesulfovibrio ferrireducens]|uniref:helix-turn-helix transcriptional regulator n=1 Tax=Maridesulfovibrio ferrireducens TaxID=246191 RepID=UPI001A33405F|nr:WYL domain-containing protein [Maridesulfovibrio ferrireducens]MBI9109960.1 WYL domain-containing protein [Maridesulfovibrio ferrireducens]